MSTRWFVALFVVAALAGCSTSREPTLYALASRPGTVREHGPRTIELRKPALAGYLDQDGIVEGVSDFRVRVAREDDWGEPLGDMVARVLAEDLAARLPGTTVLAEGAGLETRPEATVSVAIQRFDRDGRRDVVLRAQVAVERRGAASIAATPVELRVPVAGSDTRSLVAAMSDLLGELADRIAPLLRDEAPVRNPAPADDRPAPR